MMRANPTDPGVQGLRRPLLCLSSPLAQVDKGTSGCARRRNMEGHRADYPLQRKSRVATNVH